MGPSFDLADEARLDVAATELHTVDLKALAAAQKTCPQVASHRQGKHASGLLMKDVELIPGSWVYCEGFQVHGVEFRGGHIQPSFVRQVEGRRVGGQIGRRVGCPKEACAGSTHGVCYEIALSFEVAYVLCPL